MDMEGTRQKTRTKEEFRAWDELVPDVLGLIFRNLPLSEILQVIPRVCKPWGKAVKGPYSWEKIDIDGWITRYKDRKVDRMLRMLVTRSSGLFRELCVSWIKDHQLKFVAEHARSLQILSIQSSSISDSIVEHIAPKLSSLTTIDLSYCNAITAHSLTTIGTNCKSLESLTFNSHRKWCPEFDSSPLPSHDDEGRAIARTMPKLRHLSIAYANISTEVALEILSGCPELESLNIKGCWRVYFKDGVLEEEYPKVKVVEVDHKDPDDDYDWGVWNDYSSGISSPEPDYTGLMIDYYSL